MNHTPPLSFSTPCYYAQHGRVVTAKLGDFKDLVSKVFRDYRVKDRHYVVTCTVSDMHYVAKWDGEECWMCGFSDKEQAQKTLEQVQAKEILANAYGHLHLTLQGAQKELDAPMYPVPQQSSQQA